MSLTEDLASVVGLMERGRERGNYSYRALAVTASYRFMRRHAGEIAELMRDAERYRFLRETNRFKHYVDGVLEREDKIDNDKYDAAVDHAMAYANDAMSAALSAAKERGDG